MKRNSIVLCITILCLWLLTGYTTSWGQKSKLSFPKRSYQLPKYIEDRLSPSDRELFNKLINIDIETAWTTLNRLGYTNQFTNRLTPILPQMKMVGRARTMRYLPKRQDVQEALEGPMLHLRSSEEAQPGDILVFDAGGDIGSCVTGDVTTTRFMANGGAGIIVYGAIRDVPELINMKLPVYTLAGQAAPIQNTLMTVDYQVPVSIGDVTVIPGDYILGDVHGLLVIPAAVIDEVIERAFEHQEREEFLRMLLIEGESIYGVYPRMSRETRERYEEWRKEQEKNK